MAEKEIIKEYSNNDDITVIWKPKKCIHSGICVATLPKVYDPDAKPWIKPEKAGLKELKSQIERCPSGALDYKLKNGNTEAMEKKDNKTKIEVLSKGPLMVHGLLEVTLADGRTELKKRSTAFCRCGASSNKPYCDGTHNDRDFEG